MAERNPSKQRRQAQNRAAREARKARSVAANTPVEERRPAAEDEPDDRRSRRRRARKSRDEIKAEARSVIEAEEAEAIDDDTDFDVDAGDEVEGDDDGAVDGPVDQPGAQPVAADGARRGSSPIFSARHRAAIAATTADRAPARTHAGVARATGTEHLAPRGATPARNTTSRPGTSGPAGTRKTSASATGTRKSTAVRANATTTTAKTRASSAAAPRKPARPPAKPLPPFFDRFGGNEPGGRWVLLSFATVVLASIVLNFVHIIPEVVENAKGKKVQTGEYFTIWHFGLGPGLMFLLPPILILGLFIITAKPWDRRRSWNFALALMALSTFLTQSISIYIIPIACLAWGCWKARKAALEEVGGDPQVLREVERERRVAGKEAMRARRRR